MLRYLQKKHSRVAIGFSDGKFIFQAYLQRIFNKRVNPFSWDIAIFRVAIERYFLQRFYNIPKLESL